MAGFEIVVRPVVFPDIRPRATQSLPPKDDPDKGFAVIRGNGAKLINTSYSFSASTSSSQRSEVQRRVDQARVHQMNDDGTVNKQNFVDMKVANKIWMDGPREQGGPAKPGEGGGGGGEGGPVLSDRATGRERVIHYFTPVTETKNIEIKKRNLIIINPRGPEGGGGGGGGD